MRLANPATTREYVLEADRKSDPATVFVLRRLTREQLFEYASRAPFTVAQATELAAIRERAKREARALTAAEQKHFDALEPKTFADIARALESFAYTVSVGVVEIRNLLDERGKPLKMTPEKFAKVAPAEVIKELGEAVLEHSVLSEDDRKN